MARSKNPKGMLKAVKDTVSETAQTETPTASAETPSPAETETIQAETPAENLFELPPSTLAYLQGYVNQTQAEIDMQRQSPEYQSVIAQAKAALDRFTAIKGSLSSAFQFQNGAIKS